MKNISNSIQTNMLNSSSSIESEKVKATKEQEDYISGAVEEIKQLEDSKEKDNRISILEIENKQLQNQINELKALVKQMSDSTRSELLELGITLLSKAGVFDSISSKLSLTPEILNIINRSQGQDKGES